MRVHFSVPPHGVQLAELEQGFSWVAEAFHMSGSYTTPPLACAR